MEDKKGLIRKSFNRYENSVSVIESDYVDIMMFALKLLNYLPKTFLEGDIVEWKSNEGDKHRGVIIAIVENGGDSPQYKILRDDGNQEDISNATADLRRVQLVRTQMRRLKQFGDNLIQLGPAVKSSAHTQSEYTGVESKKSRG